MIAVLEVTDGGESAGFWVGSYSKQVFPFRSEDEARLGAQRRTWKVGTGMGLAEWRCGEGLPCEDVAEEN